MVELVVVPGSQAMGDEIRVYLEDVGAGKGFITIVSWGNAWTAYFGGMGDDTIRRFVERCGPDYLTNKMGLCEHFKKRKADEVYLNKLIRAVQSHLKANPVAAWVVPERDSFGPRSAEQIMFDSMNGTSFGMK